MSDKEVDRIQAYQSTIIAWYIGKESELETTCNRFSTESTEWLETQQIASSIDSPRFCLGTDYHFALVPSCTAVGDIIVRFWNCSASVVMRPVKHTADGIESSVIGLIGRSDIVGDVYDGIQTDLVEVCMDIDLRTLQMITVGIST